MASYGDVSLAGMQNQPLWRQLLQRLQQSGVQIDPSQTSGFAPRNIAGTNTPSQHAFGRAMDVNYNANPEGQANQRTPLPYDMYGESARKPTTFIDPDVARDAASRLGFKWGGDFQSRSPDPMHFEGPVGPAMPTPLRAPMGAFGLGGPPAEQPQDFQTMFPGTPQAGETMSSTPAPANDPYPYGKEPDMAPVAVAGASGASPITTGSTGAPPGVERRGDMSGGMAPAMAGGGGFGNWLQGLGTNPLFLGGLTMLAGQGPAAGAQIANTALTQRRAETLFQQQQTEYNKRQQIWDQAFPGGTPNTAHTLLKGLTPEMAATIYSLGPEAGLPILGKYQLADAEARQAMDRQLEQLNRITGGGIGGPASSAGALPSGPAAAPSLGQSVVTPPAGTVMEPPRPIAAGDVPPALAPPAPVAGAAARAPAAVNSPMVSTIRGPMTIPDAEKFASQLEFMKIPTGELRQSITRAAAGQQAAATKQAEMDVAQQQAKPKARETTSALVEGLDRMQALAQKIHDDPSLGYATGMWSQPGNDAARIGLPYSSGPGLPLRFWGVTRPGSATANVERDMTTLSQQIGLSTLQALKQASSTGASGLGSTSEPEINMLKNAIAGIGDPTISKEKYQENLKIIMTSSERIRARMMGSWQETYGEPFREANGQTPPGYPTQSTASQKQYEINVGGKRRKYIMTPTGPQWAD